MKNLIIMLFLLNCSVLLYSQSLKKYEISDSGCSAYFFCDPGTFDLSYSEDSSMVYVDECKSEDVSYGIICVKLFESVPDIDVAEEMVVSYLDYLKTTFKVVSSVGYGTGHRLHGKENVHGVIDYWVDDEKNNIKIKGWTDGNFIVILYAYTLNELPETKVNVYLEGLVLPGS